MGYHAHYILLDAYQKFYFIIYIFWLRTYHTQAITQNGILPTSRSDAVICKYGLRKAIYAIISLSLNAKLIGNSVLEIHCILAYIRKIREHYKALSIFRWSRSRASTMEKDLVKLGKNHGSSEVWGWERWDCVVCFREKEGIKLATVEN